MPLATRQSHLGRNLFGISSLAFGIVTLVWHNYKDWDQLRPFLNATTGPIFLYAVSTGWILGGLAILFRRTTKAGAAILCAVYLTFAVLALPRIVSAPKVYDSWGNFFEQFSHVTGAALIWTVLSPRIGRICLGLCTLSFALEQAFYLNATATLVPKWLPPSQNFWAITTTFAFFLAALALLSNRAALLAARLLSAMIVSFGVLVWIPILLSAPHVHFNWSETAETFAIAGVAWILADLLAAA
jgi:hypothetical protein